MRKEDKGRMVTRDKGYQGVVTKEGKGMATNFGTNGSSGPKHTKDSINRIKAHKP